MTIPMSAVRAALLVVGLGSSQSAYMQSSLTIGAYVDRTTQLLENSTEVEGIVTRSVIYDDPALGFSGRASTTTEVKPGSIGITATARISADPTAPTFHRDAGTVARVYFNDVIRFYSDSIPYDSLIDIHLRARLDGTQWAEKHGFDPVLGDRASYSTDALYNFSINGESASTSGFDFYRVQFFSNETGPQYLFETRNRLLDIHLRVRNNPTTPYRLGLRADMVGQVAISNGAGGETVSSEYAFLYGDSLAWAGVISASSGGRPLIDPELISSQSGVDYNRSYAPTGPLSTVPEPSSYGAAAALLFGCLAIARKRSWRIATLPSP